MYDTQTRSLWSHHLGKAMSGPLAGSVLRVLPAIMTDWKTWRALHPDTTVVLLARTTDEYRREFYRDPTSFLIGVTAGPAARAWPFDQLQETPVVNDSFQGVPLVVVFHAASHTAMVFRRETAAGAVSLHLEAHGLVDSRSGAAWDPSSGRIVSGGLDDLAPVAGIVSYRRTWETFHPDSTYYRRGR